MLRGEADDLLSAVAVAEHQERHPGALRLQAGLELDGRLHAGGPCAHGVILRARSQG